MLLPEPSLTGSARDEHRTLGAPRSGRRHRGRSRASTDGVLTMANVSTHVRRRPTKGCVLVGHYERRAPRADGESDLGLARRSTSPLTRVLDTSMARRSATKSTRISRCDGDGEVMPSYALTYHQDVARQLIELMVRSQRGLNHNDEHRGCSPHGLAGQRGRARQLPSASTHAPSARKSLLWAVHMSDVKYPLPEDLAETENWIAKSKGPLTKRERDLIRSAAAYQRGRTESQMHFIVEAMRATARFRRNRGSREQTQGPSNCGRELPRHAARRHARNSNTRECGDGCAGLRMELSDSRRSSQRHPQSLHDS